MPLFAKHEKFSSHGRMWAIAGKMSWASTGFTPSGSPVGHWSADTITGLEDGDPVGTWPDQGGGGYDLAQGTAARKPTYKINIQNGKPGVLFDGIYSNVYGAVAALSSPYSWFFVMKQLVDSNNKYPLSAESGGVSIKFRVSDVDAYAGGTLEIYTDFNPDTDCHVYTHSFNSASSYLRVDGSQENTVNDIGTASMNDLTVGALYNGSAVAMNIYMHELILYDSVETPADNESGLNTKWAAY